MIIGIDGNEANVKNKVGISEYAYQLLISFAKFKIQNLKFKIYLKNPPNIDLPKETDNWSYTVIKPSRLWTQVGLPISLYMDKPRPDVFFSTTHYAPRFSPVPTVISIMDLAYLHYPEMFRKSDLYQLKNWTLYSVRAAKHIITISNSTKNDIIKEYFVAPEKITVAYPGLKEIEHDSMTSKMELLKEKYGIGAKFILFVGTLQPRKNIERLIEAYSQIFLNKGFSDGKTNLVILGKKGWLYEEILKAPQKFGVSDSVRFLEFVPDQDLPSFYQEAECFILPSLYEGFGLPVLEAMRYGCPVITSKISSLPEAGGDAAVYVDPYKVEDIAQKLKSVLENPQKRKKMIEEGHKQVKKFSWEKSAEKVLNVLQEVAASK